VSIRGAQSATLKKVISCQEICDRAALGKGLPLFACSLCLGGEPSQESLTVKVVAENGEQKALYFYVSLI
jgi:hypothetical protein